MRLDHKTFETEVKRTLAEFKDIVLASCHMAWIHEERKLRIAAAELDSHLPLRVVTVFDLIDCRETSVNNAQLLDTGIAQALQRSDPKVEVRVDRVLYEDWNVCISKRVSDLLHEERIGCSSCSDPYEVHTMLEALEHVLLVCHLCSDLQTIFLLCLLHPLEAWYSDTLEASRMSSRLPDTRAEHVDSQFLETFCGLHDLLFALCTARTSHYAWSWLCKHSPLIKRNNVEFLGCHNM